RLSPVNTTTRARSVAVDVADPDLDADVRAVLAALALDTDTRAGNHSEVVVTDRADAAVSSGGSRVVRVGSDRDRGDDDEVVRLPSGTGDLVGALLAPVRTRSGPL